jgi:hypothetical protein
MMNDITMADGVIVLEPEGGYGGVPADRSSYFELDLGDDLGRSTEDDPYILIGPSSSLRPPREAPSIARGRPSVFRGGAL